MSEVVGFTDKQREWIKERDGNRCQMFEYVRGKWVQCPNRTHLEVHHILPRGWCTLHMPKNFNINGCYNGITLCKAHHVSEIGVHPDTAEALKKYRSGNKNAFHEMMDARRVLNERGIPYWNTTWDWLFNRRVKKNTLRMLVKRRYPTNSKRGNTGRKKESK